MIQTLFGTPQPTFLDKMKQAVTRTRENLSERIDEVMAFTKEIDRGTLDDLEAILISADLGTKTTQEILGKLREKADRKQTKDLAELKQAVTPARESLSERIGEVMAFTKEIDRGSLDDLEAILISADLGTKTTQEILGKLREKADRKKIKDLA